nr:protein IQ-DOMAIN 6-like [Lolium perenne]
MEGCGGGGIDLGRHSNLQSSVIAENRSMGASGKWIKTLVGLKPATAAEKHGKGGQRAPRRRRPPRSPRPRPPPAADALSSVVAAVVRAMPGDFRVIRHEWAALRIRTAFRGFLPRRALRALRGIVRLQALVRGRVVRKQLAVTVK